MPEARFGIWAPVYGPWGARNHPDEPAQASYRQAREIVVQADRLGFKVALFAQHIINPLNNAYDQLETWTACAAVAEATNQIEIMAAVKPFFFHPAILSKMALGIDAISNGRLSLNLISGWYMPEMQQAGLAVRAHDDRYRYSREWLRIVKALIAGEQVDFSGEWFQLKGLQFHPGPFAKPRPIIYLGGESDQARDLVVDEADVYLLNGRTIDLIRAAIAEVSARPRRLSAPLRFGMAAFVIARPTQDEAAREFIKLLQLAEPDDLSDLFRGVDPSAVMFKLFQEGPRALGTNGGTWAGLVGDYDTVAQRIVDFGDVGIETFLLQFQPFESEMARFAEEIVPRVRELERSRSLLGGAAAAPVAWNPNPPEFQSE